MEEELRSRVVRLERRVWWLGVALLGAFCGFIWHVVRPAPPAWKGPPMDMDHVMMLTAAIYEAQHVRPPGPEDDPAVQRDTALFMEWQRNVLRLYEEKVRVDAGKS